MKEREKNEFEMSSLLSNWRSLICHCQHFSSIFDMPFLTLLQRLWSAIVESCLHALQILWFPPTSNTAMWNCAKPLNVQTSKHFASLTFFFLMKLLSLFQMHVWEIWKRRCKKEKKKTRRKKERKETVHVKAPVSWVF